MITGLGNPSRASVPEAFNAASMSRKQQRQPGCSCMDVGPSLAFLQAIANASLNAAFGMRYTMTTYHDQRRGVGALAHAFRAGTKLFSGYFRS